MELSLTRSDLAQVNATHKRTMKLMANKQNKKDRLATQRICIADHSGTLYCFQLNKKTNDLDVVFKTQPDQRHRAVDALCIDDEKIFVAAGQLITGVSKKGKEFLKFQTDLAEPIKSMAIAGEYIYAGGEYMYNEFFNCQGSASYMVNDRINDVACARFPDSDKLHAVLACQDRFIRVLNGSNLVHEVQTNGPASTVISDEGTKPGASQPRFGTFDSPVRGGSSAQGTTCGLIFGTESGQVHQLVMDEDELCHGWGVDPRRENRRSKAGGVHCIAMEDVTKDGVKDLLIGRDDGLVEVWSFDMGDEPKLSFERSLNESVTSIASGCVSNVGGYDEVVVSTYSGKIISFSTQPVGGDDDLGGAVPHTSAKAVSEEKLRDLMAELEVLQGKVEREKQKYSKLSESLVATDVQLKLKDKFALSSEEAYYKLQVELTVPIETVLLQCDVPVELVDAESNSAIVSRTPMPANSTGVLVTYRSQDVTNQLEMRLRTSEGRYGSLQLFVWPRITPKTCCCANYAIKPLSLHTRLHVVDESRLPEMSSLTIRGDFSLGEVHAWVAGCLPEVPAKLQAEAEESLLNFRNTFLGTHLQCSYRKGEATILSDSLTSLSIMKEVLTREATARKKKLSVSVDANHSTVDQLLSRIDPMLQYQLSLEQKVKLIDSLKEVKMQENDSSFLSPEYVQILDKEEDLLRELKEQPARIEFLHGIIVDLFVDNFKFKGKNVAQHVPQLQQLLRTRYSLATVLDFFREGGEK